MQEEKTKGLHLPFGKRVMCGNYYVLKTTRSLGGKEVKRLRKAQHIPAEVMKFLDRASLPVITVGTVADSWRVSFLGGMTMFNAIDEIPVFHDGEGKFMYIGNAKENLYMLFNFWACATSTVGDEEFQADVINATHRYLDRMSKKNKAPLSKEENEKVMNDSADHEKLRATIINIADTIKKGDKENGNGDRNA